MSDMPANERDAVLKWPNSFYDRGVKQGIEKGIEQGIKQGVDQGKVEASKEFARKLLNKQMSIAEISELTGLAEDEIVKLEKVDE
ncbi:hypothetical protein [Sporolactobacillus pectinivorans]|uniref:hypothetical protein n=1 Tax=Sporolactobacillus pectinivorans TaxID=1591408 RepID=UPI000C260A60|nr:hypothetical protein [Sporolactobacillus pectinivorans]